MSRLIDADALIAKCGNWYVEEGTEEGFISDVKHLIDLQPTIEERKTGKWISDDAIFGGAPYYCDQCGETTISTTLAGKPRWKYCPMCGAKMEVNE